MAVSDLVLGTMYFGTKVEEATAFAILDEFVAAGGTTVDTANCYSFWASGVGAGGQAEAVIGRWLKANPGVRDTLQIATKVGVEPTDPNDFSRLEGLSGEAILRAFQGSRERLGLDVIDWYWAHADDRSVDLAETVGALGALTALGSVRRLGASNYATWRVERARATAAQAGMPGFSALQLTTSYLQPRPGAAVEGKDHRFGFLTDETRDYVSAHPEFEVWAYSPLVQGSYDRADRPFPQAYDHPGSTRRLAALTDLAERRGVQRSALVLAWLLASTPSIRPILGVSTVEQLQAGLVGGTLHLDADDLAALDAQH